VLFLLHFHHTFPKKGIEEGNAKKDSENQLSIFCFSHINTIMMICVNPHIKPSQQEDEIGSYFREEEGM
jgi:hypothetical protein